MIVRHSLYILALMLFILPPISYAQESDSTDVLPPDSSAVLLPSDSAEVPVPVEDSVADAQQGESSFEQRYEDFKKTHIQRSPSLSYFDSLVSYFTTERLNVRAYRDRSFYHDAGDYFRFDPSYVILEHQVTPMRKTVQPFGLSGNRLNLVTNRMPISPFEHIIEPDGLTDLNDVPTALDEDIFILPGAAGRIFGGRQAIATLVTLPKKPEGSVPETAILADKGSFGYSWVRGKYSRRYAGGREADVSVGYRKADGLVIGRNDDAYHYVGDFYFPVGRALGFMARGQLYNRDGHIVIRPDVGGERISRDRFDRSAVLACDFSNSDNTARHEVGYRHLRQGSFLDGNYMARYNYTGHGIYVSTEWTTGPSIFRARIDADDLEYDNWFVNRRRRSVDITFDLAKLNYGLRYALTVGGRYDSDFDFMPTAALVLFRETPRSFVMASLGYSQREPSLHELYLYPQKASIYASQVRDYGNRGNDTLKVEKQLVGNLHLEIGSVDNSIGLSVTGGRIIDGIDWQNERGADDANDTVRVFWPINGDIDFINATVRNRIRLKDFVHFTAGAAYHRIAYAEFKDKAYQPEYQLFSGLELHVFWRQKLVDLFAYGEVAYNGPYHGYREGGLGNLMVTNMKLSLGLKDFRFHFVWQNLMSQAYRSREFTVFPGRYFYYGIVWNFLD